MDEITGVIRQDDVTANFVGTNHRFIFVPVSNTEKSIAPGLSGIHLGSRNYGALSPTEGFIRGETFCGQDILIHCSDALQLNPTRALNIWLYILSKTGKVIDAYDAIEFVGGSLNSTFAQRSIKVSYDEGIEPKLDLHNDRLDIPIDENLSIILFSVATVHQGTNDGTRVSNDGVHLELRYNEPQTPGKNFVAAYSDVLALIQFMTFRKNVTFDSISLLKKTETPDGKSCFAHIANVFIKPFLPIEKPRDRTRCITFDSLGAKAAGTLYHQVLNQGSRHTRFSAGFIPETARDSYWLKPQQIRDICTSMELEAALRKLAPTNSESFNSLVSAMRELTRKSKDNLTSRENSYINGTINHLEGPATERLMELYKSQKEAIAPILKLVEKQDLAESEIQRFVKIRNDLTHTGTADIDDSIADIGLVLMAVIYSSILGRCGCKPDVIAGPLDKGLLTVK